jgi:hypothetical protein
MLRHLDTRSHRHTGLDPGLPLDRDLTLTLTLTLTAHTGTPGLIPGSPWSVSPQRLLPPPPSPLSPPPRAPTAPWPPTRPPLVPPQPKSAILAILPIVIGACACLVLMAGGTCMWWYYRRLTLAAKEVRLHLPGRRCPPCAMYSTRLDRCHKRLQTALNLLWHIKAFHGEWGRDTAVRVLRGCPLSPPRACALVEDLWAPLRGIWECLPCDLYALAL